MKSTVFLLLLIITSNALWGTGCNASSVGEGSKTPQSRANAKKQSKLSANELSQLKQKFQDEVLSADYSAFVAQCTYYPLYSDTSKASPEVQSAAKVIAARVGNDIPKQNFSAGERKRLGVQVLPNGHCFNIWDLDSALICFYMKFKQLPLNAEDYLAQFGCFKEENLLHCTGMSEKERYCMLASIIDPGTGKLYASFQSKTWTPFGVNAGIVPKDQWKQLMPDIDHLRLGAPGSEGVAPGIMFHIVHYGDRPGSIIEDYVTCQP
jgi:hypothetical protein